MAELVDALDSKACDCEGVRVRFPPAVLLKGALGLLFFCPPLSIADVLIYLKCVIGNGCNG